VDADPDPLYEIDPAVVVPAHPIMIHALSGFLDAGAARHIAVEHLMTTLEHQTVATFDIDVMYDYRARRPRMVFDTDRYDSVTMPELLLSRFTDGEGTRFLLLHGPEPDFGWQRFTRSVLGLVDRLDVRLSVGMNAIPWASPHTRPIGVTAHATSPDLIVGHRSWIGQVEVPGHLAGLVELALGKAGKPALGYAVHVPHYLVGAEYPRAALTLLEEVSRSTGLAIPVAALREKADQADKAFDAQVAENAENVEAIALLEAQYDALVGLPRGGAGTAPDGTAADGGPLPSGEDIAAQLEQFLRDLDDRPGDSSS
jgi:predicted ATP-grasp superfamily ATP-dependent carboligase